MSQPDQTRAGRGTFIDTSSIIEDYVIPPVGGLRFRRDVGINDDNPRDYYHLHKGVQRALREVIGTTSNTPIIDQATSTIIELIAIKVFPDNPDATPVDHEVIAMAMNEVAAIALRAQIAEDLIAHLTSIGATGTLIDTITQNIINPNT